MLQLPEHSLCRMAGGKERIASQVLALPRTTPGACQWAIPSGYVEFEENENETTGCLAQGSNHL